MTEYVIAAAIPVFFALIGLELWFARRAGRRVYRLADAISCLSCGIGQQMTGLWWKAAQLALYVGVYELAALFSWDASAPLTWFVAMVLVDHQYYWWHRTTHRSRLFWTTHVVHHQSEDYNLAVALRQAWFSSWTSVWFYLPLALLGIPPLVFAVSNVLNTLYQFWIHTELVGKLPRPIEAVWNTPSHHRVHHAVDPVYIDRNYAGILIVWDRLYGTFIEEAHAPTYGTVTPLRSMNPVWANLEPLITLWREVVATPGLSDKLRTVLGPPEWRPASRGGPVTLPTPEPQRLTWDPQSPHAVQAYVLAWFAVTGIAVTLTLAYAPSLSPVVRSGVVIGIIATTVVWGGLLEARSWARPLEWVRLAALGVVVTATIPLTLGSGTVLALALVGSAAWLLGPARSLPEPAAP